MSAGTARVHVIFFRKARSISAADVCLACGGGQQAPLLAEAGASVTAVDNSPRQVEADVEPLSAAGLQAEVTLGDMRRLARP